MVLVEVCHPPISEMSGKADPDHIKANNSRNKARNVMENKGGHKMPLAKYKILQKYKELCDVWGSFDRI